MPDTEPAPEWVTLINPANNIAWDCPNNPEALAYYVEEKGFKRAPKAAVAASKQEAS